MPAAAIQNSSFYQSLTSKRALILTLMILWWFLPNHELLAQDPPSDSVKQGVKSGATETDQPQGRRYLLGDWGGERSKLEDKGVVFDFFYTTDALSSLS